MRESEAMRFKKQCLHEQKRKIMGMSFDKYKSEELSELNNFIDKKHKELVKKLYF